MNFSHYDSDAVEIAVDLVNTCDPMRDGSESLRTPSDLRGFLDAHDVHRGRVTTRDVDEVRALRERLRALFDAPTDADAAAGINALIVDAAVQPQLTDHSGGWHLHYTPASAGLARRLTALSAMALATVVVSCGSGRLKRCEAETCGAVHVDTSRNMSRRYCSDRCANRCNVAAFRARRRVTTRPPG